MARSDSASALKKLISQLQAERAEHVSAIEEIDRTFTELGIGAGAPVARVGRRPGRPKGTPGKRTRGVFKVTGDESVLQFVKSKGKATTADVNKHWKGEGRKGKADNTLTRLVAQRKLKRSKIKGERGSRYEVA